MKKLVIIGANDFQNLLIQKAKVLGYETHVFAWREGAVGEKTADYFYPVSIVEKEKILEECRKIKPDGVCSIASDLAVHTVNYVSIRLNLNSNSERCSLIATNKYEMRRTFTENGIPTPGFIKAGNCSEADVSGMTFPLIVKPTDRSGSRGITKIFDKSGLESAINAAVENSFEKMAIIEEYLEGEEYSCECISYKGEHHFLAFTKKFTTGSPNFIETGHMEPSDIPEDLQEKIKSRIFSALDSLDIKNGASHSEFKLDDKGNAAIIEIGSRMGGDCIGSDLVQISTGYDFMKMIIDVACGNKPEFVKTTKPMAAGIRFLFSEADLAELEALKRGNKKLIYRISDINMGNLNHVTDSSSRLGYYLLVSDNPSEITALLEK